MKAISSAVFASLLVASLHANMVPMSIDQHISISGYVPTKSYHQTRGSGGLWGQVTYQEWNVFGIPGYDPYYVAGSSASQSVHRSGSILKIDTALMGWADSWPGLGDHHSWANSFCDATFLIDRPTPFSLDWAAEWDYASGIWFSFGRTDGTWVLDPAIIADIRVCGPIAGVLAPGEYRLLLEGYAEGMGDIRSTATSHLRFSTVWVPEAAPSVLLLTQGLAAMLVLAGGVCRRANT